MKNTLTIALLAGALLATPALAQDSESKKDAAKRALAAIELPEKAKGLRDSGMGDGEVADALSAVEEAGLPAEDAAELIDAAASSEDGDAWQGNFGSFVKSQVQDGKRGKELAAAIHAEKAARKADKEAQKAAGTWKGNGNKAEKGNGNKAEKGNSDEARVKGKDKAEDGKARGADKAEDAKARGKEEAEDAKARGAEKKTLGQSNSKGPEKKDAASSRGSGSGKGDGNGKGGGNGKGKGKGQ